MAARARAKIEGARVNLVIIVKTLVDSYAGKLGKSISVSILLDREHEAEEEAEEEDTTIITIIK